MCLDTIRQVLEGTSETVEIGYKWVRKMADGYYAPTRMTRFQDGWNEAASVVLAAELQPDIHYMSGFHLFETVEAAKKHWTGDYFERHTLVKVEYKGVLARGCEHSLYGLINVVVAKHMRIIQEYQ